MHNRITIAKPNEKTLNKSSADGFFYGFSTFLEAAGRFFEGFLAALGKVPKHCFMKAFRKILISQYLAGDGHHGFHEF